MEVNAISGAEWIESGSNAIKRAAADGGKISLTIIKDGRDWMAATQADRSFFSVAL